MRDQLRVRLPAPLRVLALLLLTSALSTVTPTHASAGQNYGKVHNEAGSPVVVRCDFGDSGTEHTIYERRSGKTWKSEDFCPKDTDQFKSKGDDRCAWYQTGGVDPQYFLVKHDKWYKNTALRTVQVLSRSDVSCTKEWPWTK